MSAVESSKRDDAKAPANAEVDEKTAEDVNEQSDSAAGKMPPRRWRTLVSAPTARWAVAAALVVAAATLYWVNDRYDRVANEADEVQATAETRVEQLLSIDFRRVEEELESESAWLTGSFAEKYMSLMKNEIAPAAIEAKVSTRAKVVASGIQSAQHDEVTLILFLNVATTSDSSSEEPRISGSRVRVVVRNVDGDWRINAIDPI